MRISDWSSDVCSSDLSKVVDPRFWLDRNQSRYHAKARRSHPRMCRSSGTCHFAPADTYSVVSARQTCTRRRNAWLPDTRNSLADRYCWYGGRLTDSAPFTGGRYSTTPHEVRQQRKCIVQGTSVSVR